LKLVAPLGVAGSLGRRTVALTSGNLDDDAEVREQEVDPGDGPAIAAVNDLRVGRGRPARRTRLKKRRSSIV
jgi:hypothetical protein